MKNVNANLSLTMYNLSPEDFQLLSDPETDLLVEKHLSDDPVRLAFRLKCDRERARLVCQQVKYLGRAKAKLPSYYSARCIIPPLSYEQCSSESAAAAKSYTGKLCIDLTCGLGVDSLHFSHSFEQVISVEREPVLADIARYNFSRLGAENIMVENTSAEAFLSAYSGPKADLIYIDPARRSENERVFLLEDCSPNALELMPLLLEKADRILIKLSPLFDIEEALRCFSGHISQVEIVSVGGEVKELLVELVEKPENFEIYVHPTREKRFAFKPEELAMPLGAPSWDHGNARYLLIPDSGFYKGRLAQALLTRYFSQEKMMLFSHNGFAFAKEYTERFPGRIYRILEMTDYQPKQLKKSLKEQGVKRINILRRNFPYKSEEIKKSLNIQEGGTVWLAFTEINGKPTVFRVEPERKS